MTYFQPLMVETVDMEIFQTTLKLSLFIVDW